MQETVTFVVCSPRGRVSTSYTICRCMAEELELLGVATATGFLAKEDLGRKELSPLTDLVTAAGFLVLAVPNYFYTLPALATAWLESLAANASLEDGKRRKLCLVANCGFSGHKLNYFLNSTVKLFAGRVGMEWYGCIQFGSGNRIRGSRERLADPHFTNLRQAITLVCRAMAGGRAFPDEARKLLAHDAYTAAELGESFNTHAFDTAATGKMDLKAKPFSQP